MPYETEPTSHRVHDAVPVLDRRRFATGAICRTISTETLLQRVNSQNTLANLRAADVMDPSSPTVTPNTTIEDALQLMSAKNLSSLAVLANQKLVGIVTERDCVKMARSMLFNS